MNRSSFLALSALCLLGLAHHDASARGVIEDFKLLCDVPRGSLIELQGELSLPKGGHSQFYIQNGRVITDPDSVFDGLNECYTYCILYARRPITAPTKFLPGTRIKITNVPGKSIYPEHPPVSRHNWLFLEFSEDEHFIGMACANSTPPWSMNRADVRGVTVGGFRATFFYGVWLFDPRD